MKVSLIMPTINVTKELDLFLQSLVQQTYQDFELIVVDQNLDRRVLDIVMKYEDKIEIKYIRSFNKFWENLRKFKL